ncbi:MAG: Lrp/AsnC family transcriptional regulator [Azospirillaceae bacterium]|nr:Lrp/AsnC family transcriptional regulator [Azospirillaceae bacterium]
MEQHEDGSDTVDEQILVHLEADGRLSIQDLARKVGLSRSAVYERIAKLRNRGVIAGFTIRRGQAPPRAGIRAYMLLYFTGPICERIAKEIERIPQIKRSESIGGEIDMILTVEAQDLNDLSEVRAQVEAVRGVTRVTTGIVLKERFNRLGAVP